MNANLSILAYREDISIVADMTLDTYAPMVMKRGAFFDIETGRPYEPLPGRKTLTEQQASIVLSIKDDALTQYNTLKAQKPAAAQPQPTQQTQTPQTTLDSLIAAAVAQMSINSVMATAQPMLDKFIRETYGILPKTIEVKSQFGTHQVTGLTAKEFDTALKLVAANIPVFLAGPAGCGKNVICKQIAEALGLSFYFSNAVTQEYKISGFIDANGVYQRTQFYEAFTKGGVFMLDEIDASTPEVLVLLNAAIANGYFDFPCGRFEAHHDFRIIAAGNTYGTGADSEYTGRFQLDASSLDRFAIIDVTYDRNIELSIANDNAELVDFIYDFRKAIKTAGMQFTVSYRAIGRLAKMEQLLDIKQAVKLAILRGMEHDDAVMIIKNLANKDNRYTKALIELYR